MNRVFGIFIGSILILGSLGLSQSAFAANYNEIEQEFDAASNNDLANAESINPALFTAPEPGGVMPRTGSVTATILGQGGESVFPVSENSHTPGDKVTAQNDGFSDLDWYSFTTIGIANNIFMADVDDADTNGFDSHLQLYDANGFPVAHNDDNQEPGDSCCDSFIGEISLSPGTYFIAINSCCGDSVVDVFDCDSTSDLTRPDNENGGEKCVGPPGAANPEITDALTNPGGGVDYTLHLSLLLPSVGGELIPLDTTSLLLAGTQMNAAWMIPVIVSSIGIAIVIARKF